MGDNPMKIFVVAGARPNFMKIAPITRELDRHDEIFIYKIIHTGQHYDREMSDVFFQELGIREPDCYLDAPTIPSIFVFSYIKSRSDFIF